MLLTNVWSKPGTLEQRSVIGETGNKSPHSLRIEVSVILRRALKTHGRRWSSADFRGAVDGITDVVERYHFSPALVMSLIKTESSFNVDAVSPVGAVGLTQLMPSTAAFTANTTKVPYHGPADLFNAGKNIRLGFAYLNLMEQTYGSIEAALVAYNCGPAILEGRPAAKGLPRIPYRRNVWNAECSFSTWIETS